MGKLIELIEAAKMLGITADELTEMRSRNEIFGYRDGASWKFKAEEVERVANERGLTAASDGFDNEAGRSLPSDDVDELIDVADLKLETGDDDAESILVSEDELGISDDSTSSTIIGKTSDLVLGDDSDIKLAATGSTKETSDPLAGLDDELAELSAADDSHVLAADSDLLSPIKAKSAAESDLFGDEVAANAELGSSLKLSTGSDILGNAAEDSGIGANDSAIDLDTDDEFVIGGGSDVTLGASDSGINLTNPSDSGISLEDIPSDLGSGIDSGIGIGSGIDSGLGLEGDDMIELEGELADEDDATELRADDEFLLTPVGAEMDLEEESDDSGSQVIALDSDEFDDSAATMLVDDDAALIEDEGGFMDEAALGVGVVGGAAAATSTVEAAGFSAMDITMLLMTTGFMALGGLLVTDVVRNMWSWSEPFSVSSTLMDFFLQK